MFLRICLFVAIIVNVLILTACSETAREIRVRELTRLGLPLSVSDQQVFDEYEVELNKEVE